MHLNVNLRRSINDCERQRRKRKIDRIVSVWKRFRTRKLWLAIEFDCIMRIDAWPPHQHQSPHIPAPVSLHSSDLTIESAGAVIWKRISSPWLQKGILTDQISRRKRDIRINFKLWIGMLVCPLAVDSYTVRFVCWLICIRISLPPTKWQLVIGK